MPEPMVTQDGTEQNAGERQAVKRFIAQLRQDHPPRKLIITADALRSPAPPSETLHDSGCHSMLGVKAGDHPYGFQPGQAAAAAGRVTYYERHDRAAGLGHRVRLVNAMPLHGSSTDVRVHCIAYWEGSQDQGHHCSWVTDLRGSPRHVYPRMRGGRARWKMANETCNTLQHQGDNCEHTYGHGEKHRAVVLAMRMLLAFLVDQTQQRCWALVRAVWAKLGRTRLLWERLRAVCYEDRLEAMRELLEALSVGFDKSHPMILTDSSSTLLICLRGQANHAAIASRPRRGVLR